jgi:hypothetical protein
MPDGADHDGRGWLFVLFSRVRAEYGGAVSIPPIMGDYAI